MSDQLAIFGTIVLLGIVLCAVIYLLDYRRDQRAKKEVFLQYEEEQKQREAKRPPVTANTTPSPSGTASSSMITEVSAIRAYRPSNTSNEINMTDTLGAGVAFGIGAAIGESVADYVTESLFGDSDNS